MEEKNIKEFISEFIKEKFISDNDTFELSHDTELLDSGIIHSSGVLLLIVEIEKKYNIQIEDEELVPENFNSINVLGDLIASKT